MDEEQAGEPFAVIGVGPWEGEWPREDHYDPDLLLEGDKRNVVDQYRYWKLEAIVADLDTKRHPMHIAIENLGHDFNIGVLLGPHFLLAKLLHRLGHFAPVFRRQLRGSSMRTREPCLCLLPDAQFEVPNDLRQLPSN